ncbi:hypothetical protein [Phenylobacterium montanum]|uniref:Uncharacterized protein n=1 Tax=Phenylobacterium montanum TaxID=2823693 RepID=A0A975FX51_9CAUL|nr:hypothetical protein [Caulobacter sp. S6]QUD85931.1 hypothetical protein KCG34_12520 [Caulobacter sp. S6]
MKSFVRGALALATLICAGLTLAACASKKLPETFTSAEDRAVCATLIGDLQAGATGDADILNRLNPQLRAQFTPMLPKLHAMTPSGPGASSRIVDASFRAVANSSGQRWRDSYLAYEVDQGQRRALIRFEIIRQGGSAIVNTLYINPLYVAAERLNAFTLAGRSLTQYAFLLLAAASFATIVASEVVLFRTPGIRRKWLWVVGCLFGYGQIWVDWSSGGVGFQLINIQLLGAFALKGGLLDPWRIGFGVPLVSIVFLLRRRSPLERSAKLDHQQATAAF